MHLYARKLIYGASHVDVTVDRVKYENARTFEQSEEYAYANIVKTKVRFNRLAARRINLMVQVPVPDNFEKERFRLAACT